MDEFDHGDLPAELSEVADRLRRERYVASALELDRIKTRTMRRAAGTRAARGGIMRKRTLLTVLIMIGALGTGSAAALSIGGISIPTPSIHFNAHSLFAPKAPAAPSAPAPVAAASAAAAVYGHTPATVVIFCIRASFRLGGSTTCTAIVTGIGTTAPTGTVAFTGSSGGSFSPNPCSLTRSAANVSTCSTTFTPTVKGLQLVTGQYSGDATYAPSTSTTSGFVQAV
jgi:hypothetical protein